MGKRAEKLKDLRKMGKNELDKTLTDDQERLRKLRFDLVAGKVKNIKEIEEVRREIAQIKTLVREKRTNKE